jgi:hypothetical protein
MAHIIVYYQPQIDRWQDYRFLDARMAIQVTAGGGKVTPGVVSIQARTDANKETRTVVISNIKLTVNQQVDISHTGHDAGHVGAPD